MNKISSIVVTLASALRVRLAGRSSYRPAHCGNILALLWHLCDADEPTYLYALRWIAYPLRHAGAKMATGIIVNSAECTGKSLFFSQVVAQLHGNSGLVMAASGLHQVFNGWIVKARLVVADGMLSHRNVERLKGLVAAHDLAIQRKGAAPCTIANQTNFVFLSRSENCVPEDTGSRRFLILEAPPARAPQFYRAVAGEISDGGIEAFRQYLLRDLDMGSFNESTLPPQPLLRKKREAA
jgi:hypothetical protein